LDDETVVSVNTSARLLRLNTEPLGLQTIIDFSPYFTNSSPFRMTMRLVEPVQTRDYKVAFNFTDDLSYNKVVVFDREWNFLDSAVIPMAGMPLDVSKFVALPDEDKIVFAYSSFVAGEYASPRLFLQTIDIDIETAVPDNAEGALPATFALHQPYPNPFNPELSLALSIPAKAHLNVEAFNLLGQKVATLHDAQVSAGEMQLDWNASEFSSGVYLIRAQYGDKTATVKAVLLK
ncbi:MAG: T9SS type A sorting domain-containing protein, partial [candidate division Zixibacteria bacterium]|nr:T9SS type A sorting domain-containing protein [candidate division Zixibacteria bacterium]